MPCPARLAALASLVALIGGACRSPDASTGRAPPPALGAEQVAGSPEALTDYAGFETPASTPAPLPPQSAATALSTSLTFFTDRGAFLAQAPDLPLEDFERGNVGPFGVTGCPGPLDANSDNACFARGSIQPGVQFNSSAAHGGVELALVGPGFAGAPSRNIVANFFVDAFVIDFTGGDVTAVGTDLVAYFGADNCHVDIFGASGLLGSTTAACTNAGSFWGVISDEVITQIRVFSPTNQAEGVDNIAFGEASIPVVLDIKPGSDVNPINPASNGVIPVAVLTTRIAAGDARDFDATQIDVSTVAFGPGGAPEVHGRGHFEDVDGDGDLDLVLDFATQVAGIACGDTHATLIGRTLSGRRIKGTDAVLTVNCGKA